MRCRSCNSKDLQLIVDLGTHAWCNNFLPESDLGNELTYPLRMFQCTVCELCQLDITVPKEIMFKHHTYLSGTTTSLTQHFYDTAKENIKNLSLQPNDLIYDIGGNDGTQLLQYKKLGFHNVINIESADNIAKISNNNGVPTVNAFFNKKFVRFNSKHVAKLINASGVFFHLEELHSVIEGIKLALTDDGVFIVQFMYLGDMLRKGTFDGIYHEHLCYYSLQSLINLLRPYDLEIFDAYHKEIHGGTMIAKFCNKKSKQYSKTDRLYQMMRYDHIMVNDKKLNSFKNKIIDWKDKFITQILNIKKKEHRIYAFGAPAKGNTLLTYCDFNSNIIDYAFEINDMKYGLYTPVTHIPIIKEDHSLIEDNSYIILLSWNFADEIIAKSQDLIDRGVKFLLPFDKRTIK